MRHLRRATALAALALTSVVFMAPAGATSQASASVSYTYTLFDIKPGDGVTPFFRTSPVVGHDDFTTVYGNVVPGSYADQGDYTTVNQGFQSLDTRVGSAGNQASASATPTTWSASGQVNAAGMAYSAGAGTSVYLSNSWQTPSEQQLVSSGIELSPYSVLVIRAVVDMHAAVSPTTHCGDQLCDPFQSDSASVNVYLSLDVDPTFNGDGYGSSGYLSQYHNLQGDVSNGARYEYVQNPVTGEFDVIVTPSTNFTFDDSREVTLVMTNNSSASLFGSFVATATVSGFSAAPLVEPAPVDPGLPAIPEPSTWATMALGLVGIASVVRRRQRHA